MEPRRLFSAGLDGLDCGLSELPIEAPLVVDVPAEEGEVVARPWFGEEVDPALVDPVPEDECLYTTFIVDDTLVDPLPGLDGEIVTDDAVPLPGVTDEALMFTTTIVDEPVLIEEPELIEEPVAVDEPVVEEPAELENPDVIFYTTMLDAPVVEPVASESIAPPPVTTAPVGYRPATYSDLAIGDRDDDTLLA